MLPNPLPENPVLIESRQEFNEDGWSLEECFRHSKYQKYVSFFACIFSLPLIILPFIFYEDYALNIAIGFGVLGIMAFILSFLSFVWAAYFAKHSSPAEHQNLSKSGSCLFFFITSLLLSFVIMFIVSNVSVSVVNHILVAENSDSFNNFNDDVKFYGLCYFIFFVIVAILLGYICFSLYISAITEMLTRTMLNVYLVIFLFFSLALIYLSIQVSYLMETRALIKYSETWYASCSLAMGILGTIICFVCLIINLRKWRIGYLVIGSLFIFFVGLSLIFGGLTYRKANYIHSGYQDNCIEDMKSTNSVDLEAAGCPSKYLTTSISDVFAYDMDCEASLWALVWEEDQNKAIEEKTNAIACLNMDCCDILGDLYSLWFFATAFCFITMSVLGFCCICCLYYLSLKVSLGKAIVVKSDYLFWLLMILMVIALALLTQFYQAENLSEEEYTVTANPTSKYDLLFQINDNAKVFNDYGQTCENFYSLNENITNYEEMIGSDTELVLRLALTAQGNFSLSQNLNAKALKFFDKSYKTQFFPNVTSDYDFILFEGKASIVDVFLKNDLDFCVNDYAMTPTFYYVKYEYSSEQQSTTISTLQINSQKKSAHKKISETHKASTNNEKSHKSQSTTLYPLSSNAEALLDEVSFGSPQVYVYDSETGQGITNVTLMLYNNYNLENETCQSSHPEPFRQGKTDNNGALTFFNLVVRNYFIYASAENYKKNCMKIENSSVSENQIISLWLVPEFNDVALKALLVYKNNDENLELNIQSTFNYNEKETCYIGEYNYECGDMQLKNMITLDNTISQMIEIKSIGNYTYLFFVQKSPNSNELEFYELEQMGKLDNSTNNTVNNTDFNSAKPFIQIYSKEMDTPVITMNAPTISDADLQEPDLIWLGYCINGTIGEVSGKSIGQMWTKVESNATYYNRLFSYRNMLPDASICSGVY